MSTLFQSSKPYSAVTVFIEQFTSEKFDQDDYSGIPDLVEAIKLQASGPTEAARALRKKLKYGNVHRQLRALTILDGLIQNAGSRFQRTFVDEPLLERLRVCGTSDLVDPKVKHKCKQLFAEWYTKYKTTRGLESIAALYKQLPHRKQTVQQNTSKVLKETEQDPFANEEDETPEPPAPVSRPAVPVAPIASSSRADDGSSSILGAVDSYRKHRKDKKSKSKSAPKPFNLELELPKMKSIVSESSIGSANLLNTLQLLNREHERVSENDDARKKFEKCKLLRRHILRYINNVESEQYLGTLINCNESLVQALMTYEQLDRSVDADSDSEDEMAEQAHMYRMATAKAKEDAELSQRFADSSISPPSSAPKQPPRPLTLPARPVRPAKQADPETPMEEEDENDPFGDSHIVETPMVEKPQPKW